MYKVPFAMWAMYSHILVICDVHLFFFLDEGCCNYSAQNNGSYFYFGIVFKCFAFRISTVHQIRISCKINCILFSSSEKRNQGWLSEGNRKTLVPLGSQIHSFFKCIINLQYYISCTNIITVWDSDSIFLQNILN